MRISNHLIMAGVTAILLGSFVAAPAQNTPEADHESHWFRNVRQLTSLEMGLDRSGEAYFSPDCQRISFQAYPTGKQNYQIYVMNLDGSGLKMVSTGEGATTCSFFHPSGKKMIFAANHHDQRPAENFDKKHARKQGRAGLPKTHPLGKPAKHPADRPTGDAGGKHPGDGAHKHADRGQQGHAWEYFPGMDIYEYTFATGELQRLTTAEGYDAECAYSPDGKHIVFCSFRDGNQEIYVCDSDGGHPRRITHADGKDGGPFFSPDGKRIVYRSIRHEDDNLQIFVNSFDGQNEHAITGHDTFNWCPFWHPSGKWIIFTQADFRGRPNFDLYLMRDDGSEMHRVTTFSGFDGLPVFSPDGRHLMWTSTRNDLEAPQIFIADFIGLLPNGELRAKPDINP